MQVVARQHESGASQDSNIQMAINHVPITNQFKVTYTDGNELLYQKEAHEYE